MSYYCIYCAERPPNTVWLIRMSGFGFKEEKVQKKIIINTHQQMYTNMVARVAHICQRRRNGEGISIFGCKTNTAVYTTPSSVRLSVVKKKLAPSAPIAPRSTCFHANNALCILKKSKLSRLARLAAFIINILHVMHASE